MKNQIRKYLKKMDYPLMSIEEVNSELNFGGFNKSTVSYKIANKINIRVEDDKFELVSSYRHRPESNGHSTFDRLEDAILEGLKDQEISNMESLVVDFIDKTDDNAPIHYVVQKMNTLLGIDKFNISLKNHGNSHTLTIEDLKYKHERVAIAPGSLERATLNTVYASEHTGMKPNSFDFELLSHLLVIKEMRLTKQHQISQKLSANNKKSTL
jgi:hypothetical protein